MNTFNSIKIPRVEYAELPTSLPLGEPVFCTDTGTLYIGMGDRKNLKVVRDLQTLDILRKEIAKIQEKYSSDLEQFASEIDKLVSGLADRYDVLEKRVTNIELNGGGTPSTKEVVTPYRYVESFVSTGQTVFTLQTGSYVPDLERLEVFVGGVFQKSGRNYTESSTTTITFSEAIPEGIIVDIVVYTKSVAVLNHTHPEYLSRYDKATDSALLNGHAPSKSPIGESIVQRDSGGNVWTKNGIAYKHDSFNMATFYNPERNAMIMRNDDTETEYTQWGHNNLPIENGSWTPTIYGANHGVMSTDYANGTYSRIGKTVLINGRVRANNGRQGATGELRIGGLPYATRGSVASGSIGYYRGIELGNYQIGIFSDVQTSYLRVTHSDPKSDDVGWGFVDCGTHLNGPIIDIAFSITLKLE